MLNPLRGSVLWGGGERRSTPFLFFFRFFFFFFFLRHTTMDRSIATTVEPTEPHMEEEDAIMIPVHSSDEFVRVNISELPKDANDIMDILKAELAPLHIWLRFAVQVF